MGLLPVISEEKTQEQVRNYFEIEFPRLVLQTGYSMLEIQSPSFSGMPSGSSSNNVEKTMLNHLEADDIVHDTIECITRCPEEERKILLLSYVNQLRDNVVQERLNYGHTKYYNLKNQALLDFADSFQKVHDLHVYIPVR